MANSLATLEVAARLQVTRMTLLSTCPTPEQLRQLALGELPEPIASACAEHLDQCSACLEAIRQAPLDDPLLAALTPTHSFLDAEAVQVKRVIDNLGSRPSVEQTETATGKLGRGTENIFREPIPRAWQNIPSIGSWVSWARAAWEPSTRRSTS